MPIFFPHSFQWPTLLSPRNAHIQQWVQLRESTAGLRGNQTSQLERVLAYLFHERRLTVSTWCVLLTGAGHIHSSLFALLCIIAITEGNLSLRSFSWPTFKAFFFFVVPIIGSRMMSIHTRWWISSWDHTMTSTVLISWYTALAGTVGKAVKNGKLTGRQWWVVRWFASRRSYLPCWKSKLKTQ